MSQSNTKKKQQPQPLQNVKVVVRIRPLSKQEEAQNVKSIVTCHTTKEMFLKEKRYVFDRVFKPSSSQIDLYMKVVSPLVQDVVEGYNCTVFAYGQTGTGKTYTMTGEKCTLVGNWREDECAGVIPRASFHIFDELNKMSNVDISVKVSYIELYNEEIRDLLSDDENTLQLYADNKGGVSMQGLTEISVHNGEDICKLIQRGIVKRQIAPTLMNHQSSRSHTVFTISINTRESTPSGDDILKCGKINLVDLAGNENIARSGCRDLRATELANINKSLLTLGRVIHALVDKSQKHVPYRDSKLTRILQDSLGGHTKTLIIATVSPAHNSYEESSSTLDYASRARDIKNSPTINEKMTKHQIIESYTKEIESLQKELDAARSGTGFYVDKENYENLLNAIAVVTGERLTPDEFTAKKVQRIKHLEDLMYSKVRQFEETVELCKKHKEELENAKAAIKERDGVLEQERFLSRWYENQTAEKVREVEGLLNATKTLHSEKEILLAKLENQFSINVSNETVTQKAVNNLTNMLDKFGNEESAKMKASAIRGKEEIRKKVLDFHRDVSSSYGALNETSEGCISRITNEKNGFRNKLNEYVELMKEKTRVFGMVHSQYHQQLNILMSEVARMAEVHVRENQRIVDEAHSCDDSVLADLEKGNKLMVSSILESQEHSKARLKFLQEVITKVEAEIEEVNAVMSKRKKDLDEIIGVQDRLRERISKKKDNLRMIAKESAEGGMEESGRTIELIKSQCSQVENSLLLVKEFDDKLTEMTCWLHEKDEKITEATIEDLKGHISTVSVIEETLNEKVNNFMDNIDAMLKNIEMVDSFTNFACNIKEVLSEQILAKNIKARHAGDTPVRQSTSLPSVIQDVAPREALIAKFKSSMAKMVEVDSDEDS